MRGGTVVATVLVALACVGTAAWSEAADAGIPAVEVAGAAGSEVTPAPPPQPEATLEPAQEPPPGHFTIGDLAAGRVPQDVQDRFWQAQLDAILAAPCPDAPAPGTTEVTFFLGADEAWTARLADATAAHQGACAG